MAFEEVKQRQSQVWGSAPFERIAAGIADVHELVVERLAPREGTAWLDVACGTGQLALMAAEAGATVTGVDFAPHLVETARRLATERGLDVRLEVGDAERLPYADGSFDVVTSTFGAMFAPDQRAVARELARVVRPGGRVALATWIPEGGVGDLFRLVSPFQPAPPPGAGNPMDWGNEEHVTSLLGDAFDLSFERRDSVDRHESGEAYWDLFVTAFGPVATLAAALGPDRREELHRAWVDWAESMRDGAGVVQHREYLLTVGTRR